jgi:hypothetical protein
MRANVCPHTVNINLIHHSILRMYTGWLIKCYEGQNVVINLWNTTLYNWTTIIAPASVYDIILWCSSTTFSAQLAARVCVSWRVISKQNLRDEDPIKVYAILKGHKTLGWPEFFDWVDVQCMYSVKNAGNPRFLMPFKDCLDIKIVTLKMDTIIPFNS